VTYPNYTADEVADPDVPRAEWNRSRFLEACAAKGLSSSTQLLELLTAHCATIDRPPPLKGTVSRWWTGKRNPLLGAPGREPWAVDIAKVLDVPFGWITEPEVDP